MDFLRELQRFFAGLGFRRADTEEGIFWIKEEDDVVKLVEIIPELLPGQDRMPIEKQEAGSERMENRLMIRFGKRVDRLTLMLFRGAPDEKTVREVAMYPNIWCLNRRENRIHLYERQRADFYGIKTSLERFMIRFQREAKASERRDWQTMLSPVNTAIVAANIVVFIVLSLMGDVLDAGFMAGHGAMYRSAVIDQHEYYRLFTSMFLHFGINHLFQNMLILLLVGSRLERLMGWPRYLALYLCAGIGSSVASLFFTLAQSPYTVSAGASGAIFGVMGGLLFLILKDFFQKRRGRIQEIGPFGIVFMIAGTLSYGFGTTGVDNAAHIGGLVVGFLLTGLLMLGEDRRRH